MKVTGKVIAVVTEVNEPVGTSTDLRWEEAQRMEHGDETLGDAATSPTVT